MILGIHLAPSHLITESGESWLISLLAPHATNFVDVGANVGQWSFAFARAMNAEPAGVLFEPSPETVAYLRTAISSQLHTGLEVVEGAASDRTGYAAFYAEPGLSETSSLHNSANRSAASTCEVRVTRIDEELSTRNISHVSFLKVDTEGNDLYALLGCGKYISKNRIDVIQFEYNYSWRQAGATLYQAFDFLEKNGYKVRLLKPGRLENLNIRNIGEYFSYSNYVAYCPSKLGKVLDQQPQYSIL